MTAEGNLRARIAAGEEVVAMRSDIEWSKDELAAAWARGKYDFISLDLHPEYPLKTVEACMRNVADQLKGTGIRVAMGTATTPEERQKYRELGVTIFQAAP